MTQSSEVFGRRTLYAHAQRVISSCAPALLLVACGADPGAPPTTDAPTEPEPTATGAEAAPTTGSPSEAVFGAALDIIVPPDEDGNFPVDLWVGCRSGPYFQISDLEQIVPLAEGDLGGVSEAIAGFLSGGEGQHWPQADWRILRETEDQVFLVHQDAGGLSFLNVSRVGGTWRWSGSQAGGPCPLYFMVPDGLNTVDWRLDPEAPPDTRGMTLEVLITERECVSGVQVGVRLRGPQVVMTEDAVRIAFAAVPPRGDAFACPSNPETPVTVELPAPLGDREIIDGLAVGIDLEDYLVAGGIRQR